MEIPEKIKDRFLHSGFIFPLVLLCVFTYLTAQAPSFHARARVFPMAVGGLGVLLTLVELLRQLMPGKQKVDPAVKADKPKPLRREFWLILLLTIAFLLGILVVGFYIPAIIFIPLSMLIMGVKSYKMMILSTIIILVIVYLVFGYWLYVPLLAEFIAS